MSDNDFLIGVAGVIAAVGIAIKYIKHCSIFFGCIECTQRINPSPRRTETQIEPVQPIVYLVNDNNELNNDNNNNITEV